MSTTVEEIEKTEKGEDNKSELLLDSLEIKGYRCFEHLTIEKLGRVNLIVGKNNVGKTALLEALWIYAQNGSINELVNILKKREQFSVDEEFGENLYQLNQLFYKKPSLFNQHNPIIISSIFNQNLQLRIGVIWGKVGDNNKKIDVKFVPSDSNNKRKEIYNFDSFICSIHGSNFSEVKAGKFQEARSLWDIAGKNRMVNFSGENLFSLHSYMIDSQGLDRKTSAEFWDRISLTDKEDIVIEALQILSSKIKRFTFIKNEFYTSRIPVVRLEGMKNAEPLKNLGDGMDRILGIILALIRCKNGFFIVDEIESGLHYSVLPDVWKLIFKTAKDLNVQVFATTHSKDCIEAFAQAAYDSPEEGMLIRLERHGEKIVAKTIEEEMLVDAVNYEVEVR